MREANRVRIVEAVKRYGGLTQVELAAATGVSTATVSTIVRELLAAGVVETHSTSRSGRRATRVTMARRLGLVAGVQIGPRILRVALSDLALDVVADQSMPLPIDHRIDTTLDRAALLAMDLLDQVGADDGELLALGLALPAPVDPETGMLTVRGTMRGWEDTELSRVLSDRIGLPVHADRDANLGLIAEHDIGAARTLSDVVYVRIGQTSTAGILLDGRVHRGRGGTAGEIGHVLADPSGPVCRCGNRGCLDTIVGAPALLGLLRPSHGDLTLGDLLARAAVGDPGCRRVLSDAGRAVGQVVGDLVTALGPEAVVVGGELAAAGDMLLEPLREAAAVRALETSWGRVPILAGTLGERAEILGALALARRRTEIELSSGGTTS